MTDGEDPVLRALVGRVAAKTLKAVTMFVGEERYAAPDPQEAPRVGDEAETKQRRKGQAEECYAETQKQEAARKEPITAEFEPCAGCGAKPEEACAPFCVSHHGAPFVEQAKREVTMKGQLAEQVELFRKNEPTGYAKYEEITAPGEKGCEHSNTTTHRDGTITCDACNLTVRDEEVIELAEITPFLRACVTELRRLQQEEKHGGSCVCRLCQAARSPLQIMQCVDLAYGKDPV